MEGFLHIQYDSCYKMQQLMLNYENPYKKAFWHLGIAVKVWHSLMLATTAQKNCAFWVL